MKILPAIDLLNGQCVRLYQGDFNKSEQVAKDQSNNLKPLSRMGLRLSILLT